jgi:hypothetical protein
MSMAKIFGWIISGVIGLVSLSIYLRLSLRVWLRNLRFKSPPENVPQYLVKVTLAMLGVCIAGYGALLTYDQRFLSWFVAFVVMTIVVLIFTTGNLWWEIYWGRKSYQKRHRRENDTHQNNEHETT